MKLSSPIASTRCTTPSRSPPGRTFTPTSGYPRAAYSGTWANSFCSPAGPSSTSFAGIARPASRSAGSNFFFAGSRVTPTIVTSTAAVYSGSDHRSGVPCFGFSRAFITAFTAAFSNSLKSNLSICCGSWRAILSRISAWVRLTSSWAAPGASRAATDPALANSPTPRTTRSFCPTAARICSSVFSPRLYRAYSDTTASSAAAGFGPRPNSRCESSGGSKSSSRPAYTSPPPRLSPSVSWAYCTRYAITSCTSGVRFNWSMCSRVTSVTRVGRWELR